MLRSLVWPGPGRGCSCAVLSANKIATNRPDGDAMTEATARCEVSGQLATIFPSVGTLSVGVCICPNRFLRASCDLSGGFEVDILSS